MHNVACSVFAGNFSNIIICVYTKPKIWEVFPIIVPLKFR